MKKYRLIGLFVCIFFALGFYSLNVDLKSKVQFSSVEKAKALLTSEDQFTKNWSQFDIDSRLGKRNSTKEELLNYISNQARDWTNEEKDKINLILEEFDRNVSKLGFKINYPKDIFFVKTTGREEAGAAQYTRANYIVFNENTLVISKNKLERDIIHELFHILTRNDNNFRRDMYKIIGFELMNEIEYPDSLKELKMTNPDAPQADSYISLKKDGKSIECAMILYSNSDYQGGSFFNYMNVGFLKLKGSSTKEIDIINGQPIIFNFNEVSGFDEQIGINTPAKIHPEEILAENFVFAINNKKGLPSQWIVDKIQDRLRE